MKKLLFLIPAISFSIIIWNPLFGQASSQLSLSVETSVSDWLSGGFGIRTYVNTRKHWSFGVGLGNQQIDGTAKDLLFEGDDLDALEIDLPLILGIQARYFFKPELEGFYLEASLGNEIFRVQAGDEVHNNPNQFGVLSLGYLWAVRKGDWRGFYLNARLGANFVWNTGGERQINDLNYELKPVFPNPALSLGWTF